MKNYIFLFVFCLAFITNGMSQKTEGPVLKPEIGAKYEGALKKGLANGQGTATGIDTYTGNFSKGLPEGEGVYTYKNGDVYKGFFKNGIINGKGTMIFKGAAKDSILSGYWEDGKFMGTTLIAPYEVSNKTGSVQPQIYRTGDGNEVTIAVFDPFQTYVKPMINFTGQGNQRSYFGREVFENAGFPMEFDIRYTCWNKMKTTMVESTIRIKINKPGKWSITLKN